MKVIDCMKYNIISHRFSQKKCYVEMNEINDNAVVVRHYSRQYILMDD